MDSGFVGDMGSVKIRRVVERKPKYANEVIVTFEEKSVRDAVKAQAHRLAEHREEAGMRLHIPDHLQKSFRALMSLSYDLKKRNPSLKRSVKFDEEKMDLFMDIQTKTDGGWRRIESDMAVGLMAKRRTTTAAALMGSDELDELLEGSGAEDE